VVNIASPIIEDEEISAVNAVLTSGLVAQGPKVKELEDDFAAYCGTKFAVAFNSGTAAIHAALYGLGIGPGDEVIAPPFSFIATANPILIQGATVRFVDIEPATFNMDVTKVEAAITPRTKAIVVVDLYGQPHDHDELQQIAAAHNIPIIEDACQAIGANYKNHKAGSLGVAGCFSLYATKNIMSAEGGVMTTDDEHLATKARQFRQHGMSAPYEYADYGYNYRSTDILAAIGVEQLKKVDRFSSARQHNAEMLNRALAGVRGIITPPVAPDRTHVYHQYTLRITPEYGVTRLELIELLKAGGIGSGIYYPKPLHAYAHIAKGGYKLGDFPEAERAATEVLSLPIHPRVTADDIKAMVAVIQAKS
jgi:perosamine synthetase